MPEATRNKAHLQMPNLRPHPPLLATNLPPAAAATTGHSPPPEPVRTCFHPRRLPGRLAQKAEEVILGTIARLTSPAPSDRHPGRGHIREVATPARVSGRLEPHRREPRRSRSVTIIHGVA